LQPEYGYGTKTSASHSQLAGVSTDAFYDYQMIFSSEDLAKGNDYRVAPMPQKTARVIPIDRQISNSDSLYVVYTEAPS
jgi:hypothetical protein